MATQKAVEELSSKGLLQQGEMKSKLDGIKQEANKSVTHKELESLRLSSHFIISWFITFCGSLFFFLMGRHTLW
jgi:hypothetical protein